MAEPVQPSQRYMKLANEAGLSGAVSLYLHLGLIHWLGVAPPPDAVLIALIPAGATIFAGMGRGAAWLYRKRAQANA